MPRFLLNDASIHGQFSSFAEVVESLRRVYAIRTELQKAAFKLEVHSRISERSATPHDDLRTSLFKSRQRDLTALVLAWFTKDGPYWDNPPTHDPREYFEFEDEPVTETALAEAAMLMYSDGLDETDTVSFIPSRFQADRLKVLWRGRSDGDLEFLISNHVAPESVKRRCEQLEKPPRSWQELLVRLDQKCPSLLFSSSILDQLGTSFNPHVAERCLVLMQALNEMVAAKRRGDEKRFNELRSNWMVGDRARITDSSDDEKSDKQFSKAMTFKHPVTGESVYCTWHGKIQTPAYRIHFQWPIPEDRNQKLFVAYMGPKLTKR